MMDGPRSVHDVLRDEGLHKLEDGGSSKTT